ncbi:MAG: hypothetical protein AAF380_02990 [Bacteroidota bacterium]
MKLTQFLWLCVAFYTLWLVRDVSRHGILHKERQAAEQVLVQAKGLIDQLQKTSLHAEKVVNDIKSDYQVKTKDLPKLLGNLNGLLLILQIMAVIAIVIMPLFFILKTTGRV